MCRPQGCHQAVAKPVLAKRDRTMCEIYNRLAHPHSFYRLSHTISIMSKYLRFDGKNNRFWAIFKRIRNDLLRITIETDDKPRGATSCIVVESLLFHYQFID